jgi:hypothetical protein
MLLKTLAFRCFQSSQAVSNTRVSKPLMSFMCTSSLAGLHQVSKRAIVAWF